MQSSDRSGAGGAGGAGDASDPRRFLPLTHVVYHLLLALSGRPLHGYGILKDVERRTGGATVLEAGTLYAAIKRLRDDGLVEETDPPRGEERDARRRYYRLTAPGRAVLRAEAERLAELVRLAEERQVLARPRGPVPEAGR